MAATELFGPTAQRGYAQDNRRTRRFAVDSGDVDTAVVDAGLPALGAVHPIDGTLTAQRFSCDQVSHIACVVRVEYERPGYSAPLIPNMVVGEVREELEVGLRQVMVNSARRTDNLDAAPQPCPEIPANEPFLVYRYVRCVNFLGLAVLMSKVGKVNDQAFAYGDKDEWRFDGAFARRQREQDGTWGPYIVELLFSWDAKKFGVFCPQIGWDGQMLSPTVRAYLNDLLD